YWRHLIDFIQEMGQLGKISSSDLKLIYATDSVEEAIAHIRTKAIERFGLKRVAHMRRHFPWLRERGFSGQHPEICVVHCSGLIAERIGNPAAGPTSLLDDRR